MPTQFYTGLVAELYSTLRSHVPDPAPYARFIAMVGEPALELGCGDGDPLLDLLDQGLDVEGLDSSSDMLDRCRRRAVERRLDPALHHATIEDMDLGRRYRSIFLAGATFNLLPDDQTARRALRRIADHLDEGGHALIPLFIPEVPPPDGASAQEHTTADGTVMRCTALSIERDEAARTQRHLLRYEMQTGSDLTTLDREWLLHWYTQRDFAELLASAGLDARAVLRADGSAAEPDDQSFTFLVAASAT